MQYPRNAPALTCVIGELKRHEDQHIYCCPLTDVIDKKTKKKETVLNDLQKLCRSGVPTN